MGPTEKVNQRAGAPSGLNVGLGFCPNKITILVILGALGFVPLLMGDMFRVFVANNLGIAMCIPFCYGGAIVLFWAWTDGNLNKEHA